MVNTNLVEIRHRNPEQSVFQLTWTINNICTNHCRYCPTMLHRGQNHHYEWQHAERFALALMDRYPRIQLAIAGGEPTVSPWLKDLIRLFTDRGHVVGVTSNGVRKGSYWDDGAPDYICLSYHAEFETDEWVVRAIETQERITHTTARIMMDPERWDQCVRVFNMLRATKLGIEAVRILNWGGGSKTVSYTPDQLNWLADSKNKKPQSSQYHREKVEHSALAEDFEGNIIKANGPWANQLISNNEHYFTGWQCDIGLDSLFVQYDGSYRRGNCSQGGYVGRMQDNILKFPTEPVICEISHCHCTTDITTPKRLIPIYPR
jgi:hypothetical protein